MSALRTNAAAGMLRISPSTLRSWERRFGYPSPRRSPGGHRLYDVSDVEALRHALEETHNISSAISLARQRGEGPSTAARLRSALAALDESGADRLVEESLAVRSVERTVDELLLPAVADLGDEGRPTPELQFALGYATCWIAAAKRIAPPAHRREGVLLIDATAALGIDRLHGQALELLLRRAGLRTLMLTIEVDPTRLSRALRALEPAALALCGPGAPLDALGRIVYAVRNGERQIDVLDFRGALPDTGASTVCRLGTGPLEARDALLERLDGVRAPVAAPVARAAQTG